MSYVGKKNGVKVINTLACGVKITWDIIRSCFGSGAWMNNKGWINNDSWRNR